MIAAPAVPERRSSPRMLLICGSEETFSPAGPQTFAEITREIDALSQERSGSGELAHGFAGQASAQ